MDRQGYRPCCTAASFGLSDTIARPAAFGSFLTMGPALLASLSTSALAATKQVTERDKQQAACASDVQKLCPDAMTDETKATACMKDKRSQVSPECAKMYDAKQ